MPFYSTSAAVVSIRRPYRMYPCCSLYPPNHPLLVGGDVRRAVIDGYPAQNIIATDVQQGMLSDRRYDTGATLARGSFCSRHTALWDLGHEFYRSTHASFPVRFVAGDAFDPAFLALTPILPTNPALPTALTYPANITALTQLHGRASAVHAGSFFHLFPFAHQELLARLLAGLLSPLPGSFLFGAQAGRPTRTAAWCPAPGAVPALDCHSPDSWRALWERVFAEAGVRVEVRAHLRTESRGGRGYAGTAAAGVAAQPQPYHVLEWSVTRL